MTTYEMKNKKAILCEKIRKLLHAGFPVYEISKFLDMDVDEVKKYKEMIERHEQQYATKQES